VSEVEVGWRGAKSEDYFDYEYVTKKYDVTSQPEDHVYSVDYNMHKYVKEDIYHLAGLYVEYVGIGNEKNYYGIYGEPAEYNKVASSTNPVKFEWWVETDDDMIEMETTDYYGAADFTVLKAEGKDEKAPKVTSLKVNNTGVTGSGVATEITVTIDEDTSGIQYIYVSAQTEEWDEEYLIFEAAEGDMEKYTGKQTLTLSNQSKYLKYRSSRKYHVYEVTVCDYAGNITGYYINNAGTQLVSEKLVQNEDGNYEISKL